MILLIYLHIAHSNVKRHTNSLLMHNLWVVVFFLSSSSFFLFSSSFRCCCCCYFFISICDCFSLSIHVSVYFFPRSSSLHWIPKLFFLMVTHIHFYNTPKCQIISVLLVRSNRYRIVSFVCMHSTDSHSPYTTINDNTFCIGIVIISLLWFMKCLIF